MGRTSRRALGLCTIGMVAGLLWTAAPALGGHQRDWTHDHSRSAIPPRPRGLEGLRNRFGSHCNSAANDARTWFPHAVARGTGGYVYYHPYLARNVGGNIRNHIRAAHREDAVDVGVYGYNCRLKRGGSTWSVHSWGAAIDTNTLRNPFGQTYWNGRGADGRDYGKYIPNLWKGPDPGHRFYWGIHFSGTKDPHHFQYVTGY